MDKISKKCVPIVGIGASAGGVEAFRGFFQNMPPDSGMAFILVLHLPHDRKSLLPEIIRRWSPMPVVEATEGCVIEENCVYIPPAGIVVTVREGRLFTYELALDGPRQITPIDVFFNSLAVMLGEDAIGVVLSGTGSDGALGLKAIKARGGLTFAQGIDGASPQHNGMPQSAIATGAVDIVAPVEAIPRHIIAVQQARHGNGAIELSADQDDDTRLAICQIIHRQLGHDFSRYKDKTFLRRVQRRMQVVGRPTLLAYLKHLESNRDEVGMLFRDLLIGVTSFFRDAEIFEAVKRTVIPVLFKNKTGDHALRVWVPGCATGEEAYSLALLLCEYIAEQRIENAPMLQIFATDIDENSVTTARTGRYPSTLLEGVSPERLSRFFIQGSDGSYTVTKAVREICTFSVHSLIRDPPFSRIDLISCRNLLIYLDSELQDIVIPAFHYSLASEGVLLLGSSESLSRHENLFVALDRSHRIFQRRDVPSPTLQLIGKASAQESDLAGGGSSPRLRPPKSDGIRLNSRVNARVLERFAPAFVVVNAEGEIIQYSHRTGRFLEAVAGWPNQNVLFMARRGLQVHLRKALQEVVESRRPVERSNVSVAIPGEGVQEITLAVEPLTKNGLNTLYIIAFVEARQQKANDIGQIEPDAFDAELDRELESELRDTMEQLQSITEEHETALEELKSANEELHSVNEELQSANEELETSKEEIQSINEELQTLNGQLVSKVDELDRKNSDLQNLFESTQVATIFLDPYLVIRGFTPAVVSIYNLIPTDQGRPLTDIVSRLRYSTLRDDVRYVLTTLEPLEKRIARDDDSTHYLMRILPYRTKDSTVDGTIVTFVDVSSIVQAEQHQRLLVDELNHRVKNVLTVVISMATQTLRHSDSLEQFSRNYLGRVHALSNAYALLSAEAWQNVSIFALLAEELKPFRAENHANITLHGPEVSLEARSALALGMAIHELTTNAVKYGALSVPEGNVSVTWRLDRVAEGEQLFLEWIETDGPVVVPPKRRGFGMVLIERGLKQDMAAQVEVEFAPSGVRARIVAILQDMPFPGTNGGYFGEADHGKS